MTSRLVRTLVLALLPAAALVLIAGCGSSSGSTAQGSASPSASAVAALEVTPKMSEAIIKGQFDDGSMTLVKAAALESAQDPGYYYVAMKFTSPEGDLVGVWATQYLDASGMVWAVNDVAQNYTEWPPADGVKGATLSADAPEAQQAAAAVQ